MKNQRNYILTPHLQPLFQDLLSLGPTNSAVDRNLFIPTNAKGSNSVAGCNERGIIIRLSVFQQQA